MNIDNLIRTLCPEGVKRVRLGDCCKTITAPKRLDKKDYLTEGEYPIVDQGQKYIIGYTNDETALVPADKYVIFGDHTREIKYVDFSFAQGADGVKILRAGNDIIPKFLYYAMANLEIPSRGYNRHWSIAKDLLLPLPPLPVQEAIVSYLDKLTSLTAELELQKKRYDFYRNRLLSFAPDPTTQFGARLSNNATHHQGNVSALVKWAKLGEIGRICMCKRILKSQTSTTGDIPFYKIGTFGKEPDAYISKELYEEYKRLYSFPKKGTILISAAGTIGKSVIYDGEPAYFQDSNIVWIDNDETIVLNKYLYYYYALKPWQISSGGTIQRLYNDNIANTKIPLPPLSEQERIVGILDKYETLVNDTRRGIPALINAVQRKYEYYRERLLTF